jgi:TolB-like protein/Tfp pilus assembly protein PilF
VNESLVQQLKNRHIWRVLVAYPSVTFVLLQAVEFFINNYGLDVRLLTATIIAAAVLLPAAFLWNWRHGEAGVQEIARAEVGAYVGSVLLAVAAVGWYWSVTPAEVTVAGAAHPPARSVAVMPFENAGDDAEVQYLCDGIAESLINWLATVPNVKVISKSAAFRLRDEADDLGRLAASLGVDSILRGRLERIGSRIIISAALVDTRDESQLWGERLVRPDDEVILLERSIVDALKQGLRLRVADSDGRGGPSGGTDNPEAYERYLRGHYLIQSTNRDSIMQGLDELRAAIRLDPQYARPYADIADALSQLLSYGILQGDALLGEARNAAYTAVGLAPDLAEAHTAMATIQQYFEMDWAAADAAYEAAIALDPASPVPFHRYSDYLLLTQRTERAREMAARAVAVDSLDSSSMHAVGLVELVAGNFSESARVFGDWNRFHTQSRWSYVKYALALALNGDCQAAEDKLAQLEALTGGKMSTLMSAWVAWSHKVCGESALYAESRARVLAGREKSPERFDPGYAYILALDNEAEKLTDLFAEIVASRHSFTLFCQIFLNETIRLPVTAELRRNQRYRDIVSGLEFPSPD